MTALKDPLVSISPLLVSPALALCVCGILYCFCGIQAANDLLEAVMKYDFGKWLFSPVIVMGGPLSVLFLNGMKVCRVEAKEKGNLLTLCVSLRPAVRYWLCIGLAAFLLDLLLAYAFVENFRIVPR